MQKLTIPESFWAQLCHVWFGMAFMLAGVCRFHFSFWWVLVVGVAFSAAKELTDPLWESPQTAGGFWGGLEDFATLCLGLALGAGLIRI
jgi:hypothetical protein